MEAKHLKFLLNLLSYKDYKISIAKIKPTPTMKIAEKTSICRQLHQQNLVDFTEEITKFTINSIGKELLKLTTGTLPITQEELKALKASAKGRITPGETGIEANTRQTVIHALAERGVIRIIEKKITEVWLTDRGKEYLLSEFESNSTANITLKQLTDYLRFMRKTMHKSISAKTDNIIPKPTDTEILHKIIELDKELGTENYLPIFHLRQKLQPPLSREELDRALYRLQRQDKIELSSLVDPTHYSPEQIEAGIPKEVGGRLFFIMAIEE